MAYYKSILEAIKNAKAVKSNAKDKRNGGAKDLMQCCDAAKTCADRLSAAVNAHDARAVKAEAKTLQMVANRAYECAQKADSVV